MFLDTRIAAFALYPWRYQLLPEKALAALMETLFRVRQATASPPDGVAWLDAVKGGAPHDHQKPYHTLAGVTHALRGTPDLLELQALK